MTKSEDFLLLRFAEISLTDASAEITCEVKDEKILISPIGAATKNLPRATFWTIVSQQDGQNIIIIVRQIEGEAKHFFSIYNQKIART